MAPRVFLLGCLLFLLEVLSLLLYLPGTATTYCPMGISQHLQDLLQAQVNGGDGGGSRRRRRRRRRRW